MGKCSPMKMGFSGSIRGGYIKNGGEVTNMRNKILMTVLCIVTICILFNPNAEADESKGSMVFTLQQAIDYALENSAAIKLRDTAVDKAEVGYREVKSAYDRVQDMPKHMVDDFGRRMRIPVDDQTYMAKEGYYKEMASMGVTLAKSGREQAIETIKMAVQNAYFNLLFAEEKVRIQDSMLTSAIEDMDIANKKYELGMVSQADILSGEAALESAKLGYNTALRDLEYQRMVFNKTLGLPLKAEVELTDNLGFTEPPDVDIEERVALALENRFEIIAAKEQYRIDKLNYELTLGRYPENTFVTRQARYDMDESYHRLINAEQETELSVRKAYMDMQSAYEGIAVLGKNVERLEKAYDIARLRYDTGMAIGQEVINAHNALNEIRLQHLQGIHGYNLAKVQFEAASGIGTAMP